MKYCMNCDPVTKLEAEDVRAICPSCGYAQDLPQNPVFVLTGASGSGKSTVYPHLRGILADCEVFETDLILDYASSTWDNLRSTWLMVAHGVALNGRSTILCGSLVPHEVDALPARQFLGPILYANLDVPDDVLAERLRARPDWRGWDQAMIEQHQVFAEHLRRMVTPTISTLERTPEDVAQEVAGWVRSKLG